MPIPKYNPASHTHFRLTKRADGVAADAYNPDTTENRNRIRRALGSDGVSGSIDDLVRGMFPNHT